MSSFFQARFEQNEIPLVEFSGAFIKEVIRYCAHLDFKKKPYYIDMPLLSRFPDDNFSQFDSEFIKPHMEDFNWLLVMFKLSKKLEIENLY
mmetsp:Transcript_16776/g.16038  ORF Transcript_16776/g.16038 Transcript_16776/m.16038 type:complete len:91 (+) Transcript_16776:64-336(+)